MIIITKNLNVIKISILRLVLLSIILYLTSYFFLINSSTLTPSVSAVISIILSIIPSIIFEVSIFRSKLLDNEIIGEIFSQFEKGNDTELDNFYYSFSKRFSKKYRKLNLAGELNPIKDISFLFRVYKTTFKAKCKTLDFKELFESYNEIKSRKTIFKSFGFDFDYLYSTLVINSIYINYYIKELPLENLEINKGLFNKKITTLYDFATIPINKISDSNVDFFVKNTEKLKELISYINLPDKDERLLPIIKEYLQLLEKLGDLKEYFVLKEHIILQLTNCFHFANDFKSCKDETVENLIAIIHPFGFNKISDLINYCHNFQFNNELLYFLNSIDSENQDNLLNIIYDKIELLKVSYSNIINIAILNKLAYSIDKSFNFFYKCYENYKDIYQRDALSNANFVKSIVLYDSFYEFLKGKVSPENLVNRLTDLEETSKNSAIKIAGGRNALIISLFTNDNDLTNKLFNRYSNELYYISEFEFKNLVNELNKNDGRIRQNIFYTMYWYPVQLILENIFIPYIDNESFHRFFENENKIIV